MSAILNIPVKVITTVKAAEAVACPLANPEKMPGRAWGTPAKLCHRGGQLHKIGGTVCSHCYALKNRYAMDPVQHAYERRFSAWKYRPKEEWLGAVTHLVNKQCAKVPYFRVFDSGDLWNEQMLKDWIEVAYRCPSVSFWLASRERHMIRAVMKQTTVPENLVIRVSGDMLDGPAPSGFANTSRVSTIRSKDTWRMLAAVNSNETTFCPAPLQGNRCGECRACWDSEVRTVVYRMH